MGGGVDGKVEHGRGRGGIANAENVQKSHMKMY